MSAKKLQRALVMHPLPRVDELAYDMDADPRSMYFKQPPGGCRCAWHYCAGARRKKEYDARRSTDYQSGLSDLRREYGVKCSNPRCVTWQETEKNYLKPQFKIVSLKPLTFPLRLLRARHRTEVCRQHRMAPGNDG